METTLHSSTNAPFVIPTSSSSSLIPEPPLEYAPDKALKKDYEIAPSNRFSRSFTSSTSSAPLVVENLAPTNVVAATTTTTRQSPYPVPVATTSYREPQFIQQHHQQQYQPITIESARSTIPIVSTVPIVATTSTTGNSALHTGPPATYGFYQSQMTPIVTDRNRYGYPTVYRSQPVPPIDIPLHLVSADTNLHVSLVYDRTDIALTQQVVCRSFGIMKRLTGKGLQFQWCFTPEGHIVSSINRQVALSFKEVPHTKEVLLVAKNYEVLGGMVPKWRVVPASTSAFMRVPPEGQVYHICLDADPSMVLDTQLVSGVHSITGMKRMELNVVLRKNTFAGDLRQKWFIK